MSCLLDPASLVSHIRIGGASIPRASRLSTAADSKRTLSGPGTACAAQSTRPAVCAIMTPVLEWRSCLPQAAPSRRCYLISWLFKRHNAKGAM